MVADGLYLLEVDSHGFVNLRDRLHLMLKLKQPRVYGFIEVLFDSTPDLLSC